ncbi:histidinol dehydrogenase [Halogeometricum limi]|uniref:Histidinol dehydrogenase n=1 Tax=Halogeometricum limi TaxID=555875 RepID=A0A1I6ICB2_9EURY|nr:histidinol dehydrogenase [Halogeometricum limi]SFR64372.1 sulfopropanediol 3-dehydrogenase [Halogeometricum limi]
MGKQRYLKEASATSLVIEPEVVDTVQDIVSSVREDGDSAVNELTAKFDGVERDDLRVDQAEIDAAGEKLTDEHREAIDYTIQNVREFHSRQLDNINGFEAEFKPGVTLGQRVIPIETAGVYIPGGRHPLVATPAMTIVPAAVAGVERIIACAPPQADGTVEPAQLYAMSEAGVDEIYCIGGAQAVAAMAYGTESVPAVDIVTGPGNVFTTEAKRQVFGHVGIDFLAGPSEVLVVADETADVEVVAADLLAQAEHDTNARAVLISLDRDHAEAVVEELESQLPHLQTEETARESWNENGEVLVVEDREAAVDAANDYAMEHLQLMMDDADELVDDLRNYGSLFIGHHAPVVFGDKTVGTNHCLPTLRIARYNSGIWVGTYLKTPTHQRLTADGAAELAPWAATICEIEGTHGHRLSALRRSKTTETSVADE